MAIEEAKVVFGVESPDAVNTLLAFGRLLASGLLARRRLTPLVDWDEAAEFVESL